MIVCAKCGGEISEQARFCKHCGTPVTNQSHTPPKSAFLQFLSFHKKKLIIGGVIVTALLLVVVLLGSGCKYSSCDNRSVSGSKYCYSHKCNLCEDKKFVYSNYCYKHYLLYDEEADLSTGSVTNSGSKTYDFIKLKGSFKDSSGNVVDTDWTYAVGSEGLAPGDTVTFRMSVDKDYSIKSCSVSITD